MQWTPKLSSVLTWRFSPFWFLVNFAAWTHKSALVDQYYRVSCAISLQARLGQAKAPNTALDCRMDKGSVAAAPAFHSLDTVLLEEEVPDPTVGQAVAPEDWEDCPVVLAEGLEGHHRSHHRRRHHLHRPHHSHHRFPSIQNHTQMFQPQASSSWWLSSPWKVHILNAPL